MNAPCRLLVLLSPVLLASCTMGPDFKTPRAEEEPAWATPGTEPASGANTVEVRWWNALDDPVLDRLIDTARTNNLSLQLAGVRILEARRQTQQIHRQSLSAATGNLRRRELSAVE